MKCQSGASAETRIESSKGRRFHSRECSHNATIGPSSVMGIWSMPFRSGRDRTWHRSSAAQHIKRGEAAMCFTRRPHLSPAKLAIVLFIAKHLFPSRFYAQAESGQKARRLHNYSLDKASLAVLQPNRSSHIAEMIVTMQRLRKEKPVSLGRHRRTCTI